jgi:peroxiredoxin
VRRSLIVLATLLLLLPGCYKGSRPPRIGTAAPDFTVQDSDHKITLSEFRGKVVVLNFWATWCPPCVEETPALLQMSQKLRDKGVVVLAVSVDADGDAYHKFIKDRGIDFLTVRDPDEKASNLYGSFKWPETYIIDRDGVVRRKFIGAVEWTSPEVMDYLTKL